METSDAIQAFAALAQPTRLAVFRLLVRQGPQGLPAGAIARKLAVPQNTLSSHLAVLARGGLVSSRRAGRRIIYAADMDGVRRILLYLTRDCCQGRPETCGALLEEVLSTTACRPSKARGAAALRGERA